MNSRVAGSLLLRSRFSLRTFAGGAGNMPLSVSFTCLWDTSRRTVSSN